MDITRLPFNEFIGIERDDREGFLLRLPASERYTNHLGTVHASALMALAEASSGEILIRFFGASAGIIPVVRRFECKFRKPASGSIASKADVPLDAIDALKNSLQHKGRGSIEIPVEVYDATDTHVLSCLIEWFVARQEPAAQ